MIESIENGIQLLLTGICALAGTGMAIRSHSRTWALFGLFSGSYFLGDLYWFLYLIFYGRTPRFSLVPDLSWYASLLFLSLLLFYAGGGKRPKYRRVLWLVPAFTAAMGIFFMQWGQYASNVIYAVLMGLVLWRAFDGLISVQEKKEEKKNHALYVMAVFFCAAEYGMWVCSCLFEGETLTNPYFWFDLLMSVSFLLFIPAVRKAVGR